MRKLLVLMLVLGMASLASATLQISIDGMPTPDPVDSEIWLTPSQTIILDIYTDALITDAHGTTTWVLRATSGAGSVSGGMVVYPVNVNNAVNLSGAFPLGGIFGNVTVFDSERGL